MDKLVKMVKFGQIRTNPNPKPGQIRTNLDKSQTQSGQTLNFIRNLELLQLCIIILLINTMYINKINKFNKFINHPVISHQY